MPQAPSCERRWIECASELNLESPPDIYVLPPTVVAPSYATPLPRRNPSFLAGLSFLPFLPPSQTKEGSKK